MASFVLDYWIHGRHRMITIGPWPEESVTSARDKAIELRRQIREGNDPLEEREQLRREPTLGDLLDSYFKDGEVLKKRPTTLRDYRRMAETRIRPELGVRRLKAVTRSDVSTLHTKLKDTPYEANRVLALLSSMFNFAIAHEWVEANPVVGIERYHEEKRERYLNQTDSTEIARFTEALDNYHDQNAANVLRLLLLTGSRLGEVLKATWEQFDLDRRTWTKPSHHTKQKKTEHVPLNDDALDLLRGMKSDHLKNTNTVIARGPLFAGRDGKTARVSIKRPWMQACKAAGLVEVVEVPSKGIGPGGKPRMIKHYKPIVRIHDLRHSFASVLASNGVPLQHIGKLIGHTQVSTTQRYSHLAQESLLAAANQFGKIIEFKQRKQA
jgi:integrase